MKAFVQLVSITGGTPKKAAGKASAPPTSAARRRGAGRALRHLGHRHRRHGRAHDQRLARNGRATWKARPAPRSISRGWRRKNGRSRVMCASRATLRRCMRRGCRPVARNCCWAATSRWRRIPRRWRGSRPGHAGAGDTHATPTAAFVFEKGYDLKPHAMRDALKARVGAGLEALDASTLATRSPGRRDRAPICFSWLCIPEGLAAGFARGDRARDRLNGTAVAAARQLSRGAASRSSIERGGGARRQRARGWRR